MKTSGLTILLILGISLWIAVPAAQAICTDNSQCNPPEQCINNFCREPEDDPPPSCIPPGGIDDTLFRTHCCSGQAVPGSTYCIDPADWYNGWESCTHICA